MSELQLSKFKEWFTKKYAYSAEYFALAHFDVDRGFFTANDMYNPDASNAAWVLRASFDAWNHQQAIIDQLNSVLEERTKEWLQAIDLGTYFENAAKPLKAENDSLKAQLNNMETCYIEKKKQVEAVEYVLGCAMIGPKEVFQYADRIGKALRGGHE